MAIKTESLNTIEKLCYIPDSKIKENFAKQLEKIFEYIKKQAKKHDVKKVFESWKFTSLKVIKNHGLVIIKVKSELTIKAKIFSARV